MSANISIKEGGKARMFNAAKLRTVQPGGGTVDWVPKSDVEHGTLYANENGIYSPASEGVYAFDEVRVNVPEKDSFVGTGSDGNDYQYKKKGGGGGGGGGGESGEIEKTILPSEIRVVVPPENPYGIYVDGQTITKDGMVVKAYEANGDEMQVVPNGEITIDPTVAKYDKSKETGGCDEGTIDASVLYYPDAITQPVVGILQIEETVNNPKGTITYTPYGNAYLFLLENETITIPMAIIMTNGSGYREKGVFEASWRNYDVNRTANLSSNTRVSNTPFGYVQGAAVAKSNTGRIRTGLTTKIAVAANNELIKDLATIMIDGSVKHTSAGSRQSITVSWPRPVDGKVLETTFEIIVGPSPSGDDDKP